MINDGQFIKYIIDTRNIEGIPSDNSIAFFLHYVMFEPDEFMKITA